MDLKYFQRHLRELELDGWLLFDNRRTNIMGLAVLGVPEDQKLTRRFFYWVPQEGTPQKLLHAIEPHSLDCVPGEAKIYSRWQELEALLKQATLGARRIAMEYSPFGRLPPLALVNAGVVDLVRSWNIEVVSSAELLSQAAPPLTQEQLNSHRISADLCADTMRRTFLWIKEHLAAGTSITEWDVVDFIEGVLSSIDLVYEYAPTCAVGPNSADPHYVPQAKGSAPIRHGDLILIDLWGRLKQSGSIYADITQVAINAKEPTKRHQELFDCVKSAQQAAIEFLKQSLDSKRRIEGWEVDRASRLVIEAAGYGPYFIHRTGHNIAETVHGPGTHLDSYETQDNRPLLPGCCFSIEPGIYLPGEFGVRLECNAFITLDGQLEVTGKPQSTFLCLVS